MLYVRLRGLILANSGGNHLHLPPFLLGFSTVFLLALHGMNVLKIFLILSVNYGIAKYLGGSKLNPLLTWIFNGAVLFTSEIYSGYPFRSLHTALAPLVRLNHFVSSAYTDFFFFFWQSGYFAGDIPEMVHRLQYHHAASRVFQYGLLLGLFLQT